MTFLDELAIAKFPRMGATYRIRLHGQPTLRYLKTGTRVDIPEATFYNDQVPPEVLVTRPISLYCDACGDLTAVLEQYGKPAYEQLYVVKVVPRYPGATKQLTLEIQALESHRLLEYFRDGTPPAAPPAAAAPASTAAPPAAAATGAERPLGASSSSCSAPRAPSATPAGTVTRGSAPSCPSCGERAAWFDGKWVHCGREVGA